MLEDPEEIALGALSRGADPCPEDGLGSSDQSNPAETNEEDTGEPDIPVTKEPDQAGSLRSNEPKYLLTLVVETPAIAEIQKPNPGDDRRTTRGSGGTAVETKYPHRAKGVGQCGQVRFSEHEIPEVRNVSGR
jgi:hypothetical protein